jgi:SAM-dependent methyltransferase
MSDSTTNYKEVYAKKMAFLRYPASWVIKFDNLYLREHCPPPARILDHGCGSGNNMIWFQNRGYEVHGSEITEACLPLIQENIGTTKNIKINHDGYPLEWPDGYFQAIVSNQVLCFCPDQKKLVNELYRLMAPGGAIFVSTLGPENSFVKTWGTWTGKGNQVHIKIDDGRLAGRDFMATCTPNEDVLIKLMSPFKPVSTGFFREKFLDYDTFHWVFVGVK